MEDSHLEKQMIVALVVKKFPAKFNTALNGLSWAAS